MRAWLRCAGGNPIVALAGKLAPLFVIFFFIMLSVVLILEGRDIDLEVWAAERAADSFRVVYDRPLQLSIRR